MRKRMVRTGYTVATLMLVSFCLVCFTAPRPQWLDRRLVVGPAEEDGVIFRYGREMAGHIESVKTRYGDLGQVLVRRSSQRYWYGIHTPAGGGRREYRVRGALYVQPDETTMTEIHQLLLPGSRWLERGDEDEEICYISDVMAAGLGVDPVAVARAPADAPVEILLGGWPIPVAGVFRASALDTLRDFDGERLVPELEGRFSGRARIEQRTQDVAGQPGAEGRIHTAFVPGARMVILPLDPDEGGLASSMALRFEEQPYAVKAGTIGDIMDGSPTFISYALDGLAYFGGHFRFIGLEGVVDIVVPLLLAAFVVFGTMLGSVYERQKEIAIYTAVGLSPRHVFFLFLAESLVYAVIGVVGGYLAALVLQWISHQWNDALGLSINHSSRTAIYVTLTLTATVVLSSLLPAYRAARLALPSERVAWTLPAGDTGSVMDLRFPFSYLGRDAIAVIAYLVGWFEVRGEDSSGEFMAAPPAVTIHWPESASQPPTLALECVTHLRPYDLGVSQRVRLLIECTQAEDLSEHVVRAEIHQLTGDPKSWRRSNARFISLLRRHMLGWRICSARRKQDLHERATEMLHHALNPEHPRDTPAA